MKKSQLILYLLLITLGVLVLLFKEDYIGPFSELVYNHGSNFSVSFSVYFIVILGLRSLPQTRLLAVICALLAVELFELTNGFGLMTNVYDPWDFLANALGIGLALVIDLLINRFSVRNTPNNARIDKEVED